MTTEELDKKIRATCKIWGIPESLSSAICFVESSTGKFIISPTNARGPFQLTSIAMKDMLEAMGRERHMRTGALCGLGFVALLQDRWENDKDLVFHFCDPAEKEAYWKKIQKTMVVA